MGGGQLSARAGPSRQLTLAVDVGWGKGYNVKHYNVKRASLLVLSKGIASVSENLCLSVFIRGCLSEYLRLKAKGILRGYSSLQELIW